MLTEGPPHGLSTTAIRFYIGRVDHLPRTITDFVVTVIVDLLTFVLVLNDKPGEGKEVAWLPVGH